ncbi:MBL fold metallo-hydrolase [uncultured Sphaerochaeta sp.]|uniref:MBL fold metallo-hydrolase n=1 Tax=uncultured Sphaerochaeta sp. TaxID=886478 RepID=UPI002A0A331F|nr:MBL fold metallo-hydrolase [uncultured Sphaerochaeta sp.]
MRIYQHFSIIGFCNTYLVAQDGGGDAMIIDPGHVDIELINLIENNKFKLKSILLTHRHASHTEGVKTLLKIYNPTIYAAAISIYEYPVTIVRDREILDICGLSVEIIHVPGHSLDSMAYKIDHALFSGDTLFCGRIGSTTGYMEKAVLIQSIYQRLMSLDENILLFPGHGTPSKLRIERMFNNDLMQLGPIETERERWRETE